MLTAIIILEYNNASDTINCLRSLQQYNTAPVRIIVVDNGSPSATVVPELDDFLSSCEGSYRRISEKESVPQKLSDYTLLTSSVNDGYAAGNNKGLKLAYADPDVTHIMILNSDILLIEDIIPNLITDCDSNPKAALVSPLLYKKDLVSVDGNCARKQISLKDILLYQWCMQFDLIGRMKKLKIPIAPDTGLQNIELPSGSCMLGRKDLFKQIGGFDSGTFLYYEENILWEKIKRLGKVNYLDTNMRCIHLGATSTKKESSEFMVLTSMRSQYYFVKNYLNASRFCLWSLKLAMSLNTLKIRFIKLLKRSI